jgi:hypothetical protein
MRNLFIALNYVPQNHDPSTAFKVAAHRFDTPPGSQNFYFFSARGRTSGPGKTPKLLSSACLSMSLFTLA